MLVRIYLSYFSLCRAIPLAKRLTNRVLDSIISPPSVSSSSTTITSVLDSMDALISRYVPGIVSILLCQGITWTPSWKAVPSKISGRGSSLFATFSRELFWGTVPFQGSPLWSHYVRYPLDPFNETISAQSKKDSYAFLQLTGSAKKQSHMPFVGDASIGFTKGLQSEALLLLSGIGPLTVSVLRAQKITSPGRLAFSTDAGDGKRRIFAIGNYVHQRLLRPLHDFIMRVLACLPTDGTFDQLRPLDRLKGKIDVYSFDLKSATVASLTSKCHHCNVFLRQTDR